MIWLSHVLFISAMTAMVEGWWDDFLSFFGDLGYELCPQRLRRTLYPQDPRDADLIINDSGSSIGADTGGQD
jgi:hypothetical protein